MTRDFHAGTGTEWGFGAGRTAPVRRRVCRLRLRLAPPLALVFALASGCAALAPSVAPHRPSYVPHRVYDSDAGRFIDLESLLAALARAEVVFIGEQHDSTAAHRLEIAMVEGLARRGRQVVLMLEMFERDTQPALDAYLAGEIAEPEFLERSRPWPRYASDYRPLVELARERGWRVLASNVPRRLAALVTTRGLSALDDLDPIERAFAAAELSCPKDAYFARLAEALRDHPPPAGADPAAGSPAETIERLYAAQCLKDETMAESILEAAGSGARPRPLIVHVNGAFHSDFHQGVVERAVRRLPDAQALVVSFLAVPDLDRIDPGDDRRRADYLIYTLPAPGR